MKTRKQWLSAVLLCLATVAGCGLGGDTTGPNGSAFRTEVTITAESGLEQAVEIDSVSWSPSFIPLELGRTEEMTGVFFISFRSRTGAPLEIRYELRFLDRDEFLVDVFNPFGQPVRLGPRETKPVEGDFRIRFGQSGDADIPVIMRVVVRVARAQ